MAVEIDRARGGDENEDASVALATLAAAPRARTRNARGSEPGTPGTTMATMATIARTPTTPPTAAAEQLSAQSSMLADPRGALRSDELARVALFYRVITPVALATISALPFLGGHVVAKTAFALGLLLYLVVETWFVRAVRDPDRYTERFMALAGGSGVVAAFTGVYYWGVFSPAPAMIVMALYFNSLLGSARYTFIIYAACAVIQAALATLILTGVIPDLGIITSEGTQLTEKLMTQGLIQAALLATYLIGRLSLRSTERSVTQLTHAVRSLAQREALLSEARQEMERAGWVGSAGRFSEQVLGGYRLGVVIGRGAMGEIYEAEHVETGTPAAVKLLHRNVLANPAHLARFARETRAAASLQSRHVVRVYDVSDETSPVPYLIMERLVGRDLGEELRERRRLSLPEVSVLVEQVALGLECARDAGIVHRDLKPQNVFRANVRGTPLWKILDFGVSKLADSGDTLTGAHVVGTPSYMAPEQARGKKVDHRADVHALAAIAYRALTGFPAFRGRDVPKVLHDVAYAMPARPSSLADVREEIDLVLAVALAKQPDQRFATAGELARAFHDATRGTVEPAIRERAHKLLRKFPWGETIG